MQKRNAEKYLDVKEQWKIYLPLVVQPSSLILTGYWRRMLKYFFFLTLFSKYFPKNLPTFQITKPGPDMISLLDSESGLEIASSGPFFQI